MDREKLKEELALHLAKSVLSGSFVGRDNLFRTLTPLAGVAIPTYLAMLEYLGDRLDSVPAWVRFLPIALWVVSLGVSGLLLIPRRESFDLKDLEGILAIHSGAIDRAFKWAVFSALSLLAGLAIAGGIVVAS